MNAYFKTLGSNQPEFLVNLPVYSVRSVFNLFNKASLGILTVPGPGLQEQEVTNWCVVPELAWVVAPRSLSIDEQDPWGFLSS